ncbi:hypothetical protein WR25_16110 [Diploscapter pachys]|uniref:Protein-tyrosine-phosphatase n=1 Tax=Diploscapter pachys TaxID=2018661 RepID=A0A2A2LB00_9BILA|nr:hypothetical protein WR25_16110 [Diploscapter pachys]
MSRVGIFGQISEINDHLFLSGAGVLKPDKLRQKKIVFIVNATTEEPNAYFQGVDYMKIRIDDHPYARLSDYFDQVADKIKQVKDKGGKTLVHCVAGVSRSASLVIVYLIKHERMTLRQAYHYVKSARPVIKPNIGFWKQMVDYEKHLRGTSTVQMLNTPQCDLPIPDVYMDDIVRLQKREEEKQAAAKAAAHNHNSSHTSSALSPSTRTIAPALATMKKRGYSASSLRPSQFSSTLRHPSPSLALTSSYSLFSPAPSRKPRDSLFSIYASSNPRHTFFSAF